MAFRDEMVSGSADYIRSMDANYNSPQPQRMQLVALPPKQQSNPDMDYVALVVMVMSAIAGKMVYDKIKSMHQEEFNL